MDEQLPITVRRDDLKFVAPEKNRNSSSAAKKVRPPTMIP